MNSADSEPRGAIRGDDFRGIQRQEQCTGPDSGAIGGAAHKGRNHDDFVVAWSNRHAYAVVLAALLFPQQGVGLGIEETGVRIEGVQHARDGPIIDGFIRVHRLGVVLLDNVVDLGKRLQAVTNISVAIGQRCGAGLLREEHTQKTASQ